jgi:hypothetical protein
MIMLSNSKVQDPTASELYNYFVDRVRDNLHVCLCFSPVGQKFRDRFRKFPALIQLSVPLIGFCPGLNKPWSQSQTHFCQALSNLDTTN